MGAQGVARAFRHARDEAMEHITAALGEQHAALGPVLEQTEFDRRGMGGEHRDIGAARFQADAQRRGTAHPTSSA